LTILSHPAVLSVLAASSSKSTTSSGSSAFSLIFLVVIFGVGYFFFIRPRSQQARRQRDTLMELSAGDEVLTGAGIFGTVLDVESDRVTLETAPGTRITVLRSTIARKITDPATEPPSWDDHDEDEAHGAYEDYEHDRTEHDDEHDDEHDETDHDETDHDHDAEAHDGSAGDGAAENKSAVDEAPDDKVADDEVADAHDTGATDGAGDQDKKKP
jgi:preprotein translocase subunit YajC